MSLEAINAVVQSAGTLLIATTLVLTYRQLKEASKQTQNLEGTLGTTISQNVIDGQRTIWSFFCEDEELLKWYLRSRNVETNKSHSENKIRLFIALKLDFYESLYLQNQQGNMNKDIWSTWCNAIRLDLQDTCFKEVWFCMEQQQLYARSFKRFINTIIGKSDGFTSLTPDH